MTEAIQALSATVEDAGETDTFGFTLVPLADEEDAYMALFADGSYTRWLPPIGLVPFARPGRRARYATEAEIVADYYLGRGID